VIIALTASAFRVSAAAAAAAVVVVVDWGMVRRLIRASPRCCSSLTPIGHTEGVPYS